MHQLFNTRKVMFNHSVRDWDPRGITRTWSLGSLTVHLLVKCKDLCEASHIIEAKMNKMIPLKEISYPHFFKLGTIVSLVLGCQKCNKRIASFSKRKGKKRTMNITETYLGPIFFYSIIYIVTRRINHHRVLKLLDYKSSLCYLSSSPPPLKSQCYG